MGILTQKISTAQKRTQKAPKGLLPAIAAGLVVALLVIVIGLVVTRQGQRNAAQLNQALVLEAAAIDQIDAGNFPTAIKMLTEVIALVPRRSEPHYYRAVAYNATGDLEHALADFDVAIDANPHWALSLAGRASVHAAQGNLDAALEDYNKAINLEPGEPALYTNRGQIYHQQGELELAKKDLTMAVDLGPDLVAARFNRGVLLYALGQTEAALEDFSAAIELDRNQPPLYFNRGLIFADLGNIEAATNDLEQFIAMSSNEAWVDIAQTRLAELE